MDSNLKVLYVPITDIHYWITHPAFVLKSAAAILDYPTFSALRYALVILSHSFRNYFASYVKVFGPNSLIIRTAQ